MAPRRRRREPPVGAATGAAAAAEGAAAGAAAAAATSGSVAAPAPAAVPDVGPALRSLAVAALAASAFFVIGLVATRALLGEAAVAARIASTFEAGGVAPGWLHAVLPTCTRKSVLSMVVGAMEWVNHS